MTSNILNGLCQEFTALFAGTGNTILRATEWKPEQMPVYILPCIVIELKSSPEMYQFCGGTTCANWQIGIKTYFNDYDSGLNDSTGDQTKNYEIIDTIVEHIASMQWLSDEMKGIVRNNGFKMTLNGAVQETSLAKDGGGMIPGFEINYDTIALDTNTNLTENENFATQTVDSTVEDNKNDILEQPAPVPVVLSNSPVKVGSAIILSCSPDGCTYSWVGPDSFTSTEQDPTILNAIAEMAGEYICTVSDRWGRIAQGSCTVVINP